ncbi:hypothetical protein DL764_003437 [Monosporascus ibericus]|uniref:Uncharacterized protein n=1 Tax=Monosporascus ibericus TaxID=155417 RepID=A0A4Q4TKB4_9PEZI|nr:hypothetical protein DL764_003437 [Monosporascus ibericus]
MNTPASAATTLAGDTALFASVASSAVPSIKGGIHSYGRPDPEWLAGITTDLDGKDTFQYEILLRRGHIVGDSGGLIRMRRRARHVTPAQFNVSPIVMQLSVILWILAAHPTRQQRPTILVGRFFSGAFGSGSFAAASGMRNPSGMDFRSIAKRGGERLAQPSPKRQKRSAPNQSPQDDEPQGQPVRIIAKRAGEDSEHLLPSHTKYTTAQKRLEEMTNSKDNLKTNSFQDVAE